MKSIMLLMRFALALLALAIAAGLVYCVFIFKPADSARDILVGAIGSMITLATISFNYFFTSSASAAQLHETIAKQGEMLASSTPAP